MSKLSKEQFDAYLEQIKELAEGPFEEMQPEIEVTNTSFSIVTLDHVNVRTCIYGIRLE